MIPVLTAEGASLPPKAREASSQSDHLFTAPERTDKQGVRFAHARLRAFTLLELLVATACLAVTAAGILSAVGFADSQNSLSRQRLIALSIATSGMETYKSKAFTTQLSAGSFSTDLTGMGLPTPATQTVSVTATGDPTVFNVTVQVSWTVMTTAGPTTRMIHLDTALQNNNVP